MWLLAAAFIPHFFPHFISHVTSAHIPPCFLFIFKYCWKKKYIAAIKSPTSAWRHIILPSRMTKQLLLRMLKDKLIRDVKEPFTEEALGVFTTKCTSQPRSSSTLFPSRIQLFTANSQLSPPHTHINAAAGKAAEYHGKKEKVISFIYLEGAEGGLGPFKQ